MRRKIVALLVPLVGLLAVDAAFAAKKPAKASPLQKLFDQVWQEDLADDPISATALGDHRYDDKLPDMSPEGIDKRNKRNFTRLQALRKINKDKLDKADQLNYDLFDREIKRPHRRVRVQTRRLYAFRSVGGPQLLPELAEFAAVQDGQGLRQLDRAHQRLRHRTSTSGSLLLGQGATEGRTQPQVIVEKVLEQIKAQLVTDPEASPFYAPFKKMPASIDAANKTRLAAAGKAAVQTVAMPAFQRLDKFLRDVYLPAARDAVTWASAATPAGDAVLPQPHQVLHHHRQHRTRRASTTSAWRK